MIYDVESCRWQERKLGSRINHNEPSAAKYKASSEAHLESIEAMK